MINHDFTPTFLEIAKITAILTTWELILIDVDYYSHYDGASRRGTGIWTFPTRRKW